MTGPASEISAAASGSSVSTGFVFPGAVGELLQDHCDRDALQARLTAKFRMYYRLRPWIPVLLRQVLQRARNRANDVEDRWYIPDDFVEDLHAAIDRDRDRVVIHPWPHAYQIASVLTHDVETSQGLQAVDRLAAMEERLGLRSAWYFVPHRYKVDTGLLRDLQQRGHEVGVHGFNHDGRLFESKPTFDRRKDAINQAVSHFGATGFRAPMVHRNLEWLQSLDIDYDASCFDIDPFQAMPGGVGGVWPFIAGKFVELPYTLPQDHTLLVTLKQDTADIWIDKLAFLRKLFGMAMLITHPDYLDTPKRLLVYQSYLEHVVEQPDCWHALPHQVASWWRTRDALRIAADGEAQQILGHSAEKAKLFRLGDLPIKRAEEVLAK